MKIYRSESIGFILVTLVSLAFVFYYYSDVLSDPNRYLFSDKGDAIKNYFTYADHAKEAGVINTTMMNYPYGENFLYLDCHPLLTVIIKCVAIPFPGITDYSIGIINFMMIISYVISAILIYLILLRLKVNPLYAALGAFSVSVFSPQVYRFYGHFALSYSFMIPLTWYLFIRFTESKSPLRWSVYILINNLFWYLMHGYMGMIAVSFTVISYLSHFIIFKTNKLKNWKWWLYFALQTVVPLVIFWSFINFSDSHIARNKTPFGILEYVANIFSVFIPHREPFKVWFEKFITTDPPWEGLSYVGLASSFMIAVFVFNNLLKIVRLNFVNDRSFLRSPILIPALISSVLLLFLSMGYPFKLKMEYLLDYVKVINNFRAIGRFAWVFFYVITVWAIYYAYLFFESRKKYKVFWIPFIVIIPFSFIYEALPYHREASPQINKIANFFSTHWLPYNLNSGIKAVKPSDYQAIIPLPYYLIGSEDYKKSATDKIYQISMAFGYYTGLPITGNYSTNSSILESRKLYQLFAPPFYTKEIEKDLSSDKPFLVIFSKEDLNPEEKSILSRCKLLFEREEYSLFSISREMLFIDSSTNYINAYNGIKKDLVSKAGFLVKQTDSDKFIRFDTYDSLESDVVKSGEGAFKSELKKYNKIAEIKPGVLKTGKSYIISFWIFNDGPDNGQKVLDGIAVIEHKDNKGQVQWPVIVPPAKSVNIDGQWTLVELEFTVQDNNLEYSVLLKGNDKSKLNVYVDDLLIREKGSVIYKELKSDKSGVTELFYNNHHIRKDT
ncbi:MAG: hypothetical protein ACM3ME_06935 [Chloroflexota bacterium]|nr:hypothetical protein [Lentimicrobium sp.]